MSAAVGARSVTLRVDGEHVEVPAGTSVAAAIARTGTVVFRRSASGAPRGPLCGMGICCECRVDIDGRTGVRSCMVLCEDGMEVRTADA